MQTYFYFQDEDKTILRAVDLEDGQIQYSPARLRNTAPERCIKLWRGHLLYDTEHQARRASWLA